ncbi:hypothetical protein ACI2I2_01720 [Scandinavium sp. NPDC088450]|uniref:hypothetical protein n=1 Tax=Scandinavium sp. NPDC088450 TaxID=3364514 RepID=UPI00384AB6FA
MQKERVFKKRYALVPMFFALMMFGWIFHSLNFPIEQSLYKKEKVNNLAVLYITEASAGAMTSFSYRYYLHDAKKSEQDFMDHIDDETPFMITSDENAKVTVKDGQVYLSVHGEVFSYRNTGYLAQIHLDASPY